MQCAMAENRRREKEEEEEEKKKKKKKKLSNVTLIGTSSQTYNSKTACPIPSKSYITK